MSKPSVHPTISHHFVDAFERPREWNAIRYKSHKVWSDLTWQDYYRHAEAVGLGLLAMGVKRGDRVAVLADTRWEWAAIDFGILGIGAVTVPLYPSQKAEDIELILNNSEAKILFIENQVQLTKWETIAKRCRSVTQAVLIQPSADLPENILAWDELSELGLAKFSDKPKLFAKESRLNKAGDLATIVYTSGTMGEPKGAMLTHDQIISEVSDLTKLFKIGPEDCSLTFLPYSHVLGRVELWLHTYIGFTLAFAESTDRLRVNLKEIRPTLLVGVPRIFEKIYAGILAHVESRPLFKALRKYPTRFLVDLALQSKVREGMGGRLRFAISGGAPLESKIAHFFRRTGLLLLEGYGLTETTAAITVNRIENYEFGTAGQPIGDVELKIADDGEVLVKSRKVMKGYYRNEEGTKAAFTDGFFHTGDIGEITSRGNLRITDRKKDLIKTAGGKYIAPQKLEGLLKLSPLISHALISGDKRKYVVALITLNDQYVKKMAADKGWTYRDYKALTQRPEVTEMVRAVIADANAQLASFETIKNFAILPQDFSIEAGELTPSLKVKRRVCDLKYKDILAEL